MSKVLIAIPSYKRPDAIASKTLALLRQCNIALSDIYVFVVAEEYALYKSTCPDVNVIEGKRGLINQRAFIQNYFPLDTYIVMIDDDIKEIYRSTSQKTKEVILDLRDFFEYAFDIMEYYNLNFWGVYPVDNIMFSFNNPEYTTDLKYIVGAMYGIKNKRNIVLSTIDSIEDKERTILYYLKERQTLRFNHICIKTKYFGKGGLEASDRLQKHSRACEDLVRQYPMYCRLKEKKEFTDCIIHLNKKSKLEKNASPSCQSRQSI